MYTLRKLRWLTAVAMGLGALAASAGLVGAQSQASLGVMSIDTPVAGAPVANGDEIFIGGWVVNLPGRPGDVRIQGFLGGPPGQGVALGAAVYGGARPDVAAATGRPDWGNSGFGLTWRPRDLFPGDHTIYVVAQSGQTGVTQSVTVRVTNYPTVRRNCSFILPCVVDMNDHGFEMDTGGPGVRMDYFEDTSIP